VGGVQEGGLQQGVALLLGQPEAAGQLVDACAILWQAISLFPFDHSISVNLETSSELFPTHTTLSAIAGEQLSKGAFILTFKSHGVLSFTEK
jgi:hypothetical protein